MNDAPQFKPVPFPKDKQFHDLTGKRFGRFTAIAFLGRTKSSSIWLCKCDCGTIKPVRYANLGNGHTKSCGCLNVEIAKSRMTTHGMGNTPEYASWAGMKSRCTDPNVPCFYRYGGRGITMCERWNKFENFRDDMGPKPTPYHSIERIDNLKGYDPSNCRWATPTEQANNRRSSVRVVYMGQVDTVPNWCRRLGLKYITVSRRIRDGMTAEKAFRR